MDSGDEDSESDYEEEIIITEHYDQPYDPNNAAYPEGFNQH